MADEPWLAQSEVVEAGADEGVDEPWLANSEVVAEGTDDVVDPPAEEVDRPWYETSADFVRDELVKPWLGRGEAALTMASGTVGTVLGGVAGTVDAVFGDAETAGDTVEGVQDFLTYEPRTEEGQETLGTIGEVAAPVTDRFAAVESGLGNTTLDATGSPALAAAAHTLPSALLELVGLGSLKRGSKAAEIATKANREKLDARQIVDELQPPKTAEQISKDVVNKNLDNLAQEARPDPEVMAAAEELGISLNPDHYSTSEAFRKVVQAIKENQTETASALAQREVLAIQKLNEAGDELINDLGGYTDRSTLDFEIRERMDSTIKGLEDRADTLFESLINKGDGSTGGIVVSQKVVPNTSRLYMDRRVREVGGDLKRLTPPEKQLYDMLNRKRKNKDGSEGEPLLPTYGAIDGLRKDIAKGYRRKGDFMDADAGDLDQVYAVLIQDQRNAAHAAGVGELFDEAQKAVRKRKKIETKATQLFKKEMRESMLPQLSNAATTLTKGQVQKFKNLMEAIPKDMRQSAAATMLNDIYSLGAKRKDGVGQGMVNAYRMLNRNPGAKKELFKYMPEEAQRRFDAIGKVATGIYESKKFENKSGSGRVIMQGINDGTIVDKVTEATMDAAATTGGLASGGLLGMRVGQSLSKGVKQMNNRAAAADALLASPQFLNALEAASRGNMKQANMILKRSAVYRRWRGLVGEGTGAQLAAQGPILWLTSPPNENVQPQQQEEDPNAVATFNGQ